MLKDHHGQTVSGADGAALALFEQAVGQFNAYSGNPLETAEAAIAAAPDFAMAHALRAHLFLSGMEAAGIAPARTSLEAAARLARTERETLHVVAAESWAAGRFETASDLFDRILLDHPRDILALQMGHLLDYYRGDARNLRDRVLRVLPAWRNGVPGYSAVLGMLGFGLEECGEYSKAEETARQGCEINPRDGWAHHAVAHVMEMQARVDDGIRWARERQADWATDNMIAIHNWWHMTLMHLERDEHDEVLRLYDTVIRAGRSPVVLDMIDASAMLWRLHLRGVDVGAERWSEIAEAWAPLSQDGLYAFNDMHGLIGFIGANRRGLIEQQLETLRRAARDTSGASNAAMAAQVGLPVAEALVAFGERRYRDCILRLRPVRTIAARFGGSHAQRDLLDLTLIEAARRAQDHALLRALSAERLHARPQSPLTLRYLAAANDRIAA